MLSKHKGNAAVGVLVAVAVIGVIAAGIFFVSKGSQDPTLQGERAGLQEFVDGITPGDTTILTKVVTIGPGQNQASWVNNLGKTVYVDPYGTSLSYESGTASSSWLVYVGTSTAASATYTDYARPAPTALLVDGALIATSSPATQTRIGTTTTAGTGFAVAPGERVIFNIQERFACKTIGTCETATSSNRGVNTFYGLLTIKYRK